MTDQKTISPEYQRICALMHVDVPSWGTSAQHKADFAERIIREYDGLMVLDYGCGKATLRAALRGRLPDAIGWQNYDPAIAGLDTPPKPADVVLCFDVMEHIEPEFLHYVLENIAKLTRKVAAFVISTRAAKHILPDGRNAHLIVRDEQFWTITLSKYFDHIAVEPSGDADETIIIATEPK